MTLSHPKSQAASSGDLSILPIFELEGSGRIPRHELPRATCLPTSRTRSSTTS